MIEHVILIAGASGSGKTTAIATLFSDDDGRVGGLEDAATAVDFGQLDLVPGETVRVYGVPARTSYDYMWQILQRRARGVLLLISGEDATPVAGLPEMLEEFAELQARGGLLVAITHIGPDASRRQLDVQQALAARFPASLTPVLTLDPRDRGQLVTALSVLAASVDSRERFGD